MPLKPTSSPRRGIVRFGHPDEDRCRRSAALKAIGRYRPWFLNENGSYDEEDQEDEDHVDQQMLMSSTSSVADGAFIFPI